MYYHYSKKENIQKIFESKKIYLTKLNLCKGQEDFSLTYEMFVDVLKNINYSKIDYKYTWFTEEKFYKICNSKLSIEKFYDCNMYGCCLTEDGSSEKFRNKYGDKYISLNVDAIIKQNTGYLFIYKVVYSLEDVEQYLYELTANVYTDGERSFRRALELTEEELPDNYEDILRRVYYFFKILYKPSNFDFENETRIIVDDLKLSSNTIDKLTGENYSYSHKIFPIQYEKHLIKQDDKYILLLDSFKNIDLDIHV